MNLEHEKKEAEKSNLVNHEQANLSDCFVVFCPLTSQAVPFFLPSLKKEINIGKSNWSCNHEICMGHCKVLHRDVFLRKRVAHNHFHTNILE
jgi:hypothetical protein